MSFSNPEHIECVCGHRFQSELLSIANVRADPEIKAQILAGELNLVECPKCRQVSHVEHLLIYHDPSEELLVYVFPTADKQQSRARIEKMNRDFDTAQNEVHSGERLSYRPLAFFGVQELVDFLKLEEETTLQSEIARQTAAQLHLKVLKIKAGLARRQRLPRILPAAGGESDLRNAVVRGLKKILEANPSLSVYQSALQVFETESDQNIHLQ